MASFNFSSTLSNILGTAPKKPTIPTVATPSYSNLLTPNQAVPNLLSSMGVKTSTPSVSPNLSTLMSNTPLQNATATPFKAPAVPQVKTATPVAPVKAQAPAATPALRTPSGLTLEEAMAMQNSSQNTPNSSNPAQGGTNTPSMPSIPPESQKAVDSAVKVYQDSLKISPDELSTQEDIDKLIEEASRVQQSFRLGAQNTTDQPIAMEFITGQLKSLENRMLNQVQGLSAQAEPLERKLSRLQVARVSSLEASKFALDRADKALETATDATKPIAGTSFYDPVTGTFKQAPSTTSAKAADGFTLSPGETRFDAQGNKIASGGTKPLSETQIASNEAKTTAQKEGIATLKDKINLIDELVNSKGLDSRVGPNSFARTAFAFGDSFGAGQEFAGGVQQLVNKETIDTLINLKARGGTLGALSDQERILLQTAATKLGAWEVKENGIGTGEWNIDETSFKKELNTIKTLAERALKNAGVTDDTDTDAEYQKYLKSIGQ